MEMSLMLKTLYEDSGGRFHILISSIPAKVTVGAREMGLPVMNSVYAMVDHRGTILEATDMTVMLIHPLPHEPVPLGYLWECQEYAQPADSAEPLLTATYYTLEKESDVEGIPHLQVAFRTPGVTYTSTHRASKGVAITYRREGFFLFDRQLGQISRIEQTSTFSAGEDEEYRETNYGSTLTLGEIMEDRSILPKEVQARPL